MNDCIQVVTTAGSREEAERIASLAVENQLAACAQVGGPIRSVYRWQGEVETSDEWVCTFKTMRRCYEQLEALIRETHAYDEPEILAVPVVAGSHGYLRWVEEQVETS